MYLLLNFFFKESGPLCRIRIRTKVVRIRNTDPNIDSIGGHFLIHYWGVKLSWGFIRRGIHPARAFNGWGQYYGSANIIMRIRIRVRSWLHLDPDQVYNFKK